MSMTGKTVVRFYSHVYGNKPMELKVSKYIIERETEKMIFIKEYFSSYQPTRKLKDGLGKYDLRISLENDGVLYLDGMCLEEDYESLIEDIKQDIGNRLCKMYRNANNLLKQIN